MTTLETQDRDVFHGADPGIAFTVDDQSWTISAGVLVSSGANDGVHSDFAGSGLINNGTVLSTAENGFGVDLIGDNSLVSNALGARIIADGDGVLVNGNTASIDNRGSILSVADFGVALGAMSDHVGLTNHGTINGRESGVGAFSHFEGGTVHNFGQIVSGLNGIDVQTAQGLITVVTNAAGATIRGEEAAIRVDVGGLSLTNHGTLRGGILLEDRAGAAAIFNHGTIPEGAELGNGNDLFDGTGGTSGAVLAGGGNDHLIGGSRNDGLFGDDGNDRLSGAGGNDLLDGGFGLDTLTGGPGQDRFIFDNTLDPARNVDRITDFTPNIDKISLLDVVFTHLGADGALASAEFHVGAAAGDRSDRIIYDPNSGFLFYDPDGRGGAGEVHFASIAPHLALHSTDFVVTHHFFEL